MASNATQFYASMKPRASNIDSTTSFSSDPYDYADLNEIPRFNIEGADFSQVNSDFGNNNNQRSSNTFNATAFGNYNSTRKDKLPALSDLNIGRLGTEETGTVISSGPKIDYKNLVEGPVTERERPPAVLTTYTPFTAEEIAFNRDTANVFTPESKASEIFRTGLAEPARDIVVGLGTAATRGNNKVNNFVEFNAPNSAEQETYKRIFDASFNEQITTQFAIDANWERLQDRYQNEYTMIQDELSQQSFTSQQEADRAVEQANKRLEELGKEIEMEGEAFAKTKIDESTKKLEKRYGEIPIEIRKEFNPKSYKFSEFVKKITPTPQTVEEAQTELLVEAARLRELGLSDAQIKRRLSTTKIKVGGEQILAGGLELVREKPLELLSGGAIAAGTGALIGGFVGGPAGAAAGATEGLNLFLSRTAIPSIVVPELFRAGLEPTFFGKARSIGRSGAELGTILGGGYLGAKSLTGIQRAALSKADVEVTQVTTPQSRNQIIKKLSIDLETNTQLREALEKSSDLRFYRAKIKDPITKKFKTYIYIETGKIKGSPRQTQTIDPVTGNPEVPLDQTASTGRRLLIGGGLDSKGRLISRSITPLQEQAKDEITKLLGESFIQTLGPEKTYVRASVKKKAPEKAYDFITGEFRDDAIPDANLILETVKKPTKIKSSVMQVTEEIRETGGIPIQEGTLPVTMTVLGRKGKFVVPRTSNILFGSGTGTATKPVSIFAGATDAEAERIFNELLISGKSTLRRIDFLGNSARLPAIPEEEIILYYRANPKDATKILKEGLKSPGKKAPPIILTENANVVSSPADKIVTLYTGRSSVSAERALKEGLKPGTVTGNSAGVAGQLGEVYTTTNLDSAIGYANRAVYGKGIARPGVTPAVVEVNIPESELNKLLVRRGTGIGGVEEVTLKEIPPQYLRLYKADNPPVKINDGVTLSREQPVVIKVRVPASQLENGKIVNIQNGQYKINGKITAEDVARVADDFAPRKKTVKDMLEPFLTSDGIREETFKFLPQNREPFTPYEFSVYKTLGIPTPKTLSVRFVQPVEARVNLLAAQRGSTPGSRIVTQSSDIRFIERGGLLNKVARRTNPINQKDAIKLLKDEPSWIAARDAEARKKLVKDFVKFANDYIKNKISPTSLNRNNILEARQNVPADEFARLAGLPTNVGGGGQGSSIPPFTGRGSGNANVVLEESAVEPLAFRIEPVRVPIQFNVQNPTSSAPALGIVQSISRQSSVLGVPDAFTAPLVGSSGIIDLAFNPSVRTGVEPISSTIPALGISQDLNIQQRILNEQLGRQGNRVSQIPVQRIQLKVSQQPVQKIGQKFAQSQVQNQKSVQRSKQRQRAVTRLILRTPNIPPQTDEEEGVVRVIKSKPKGATGFEVEVRRNRKFAPISKFSLSREEAFALGATKVLDTSAATFRIKPSTKPLKNLGISVPASTRNLFRAPKNNATNTFIQKKERRITSPGEIREIALVGARTRRNNRVKNSNMFR